jgi:hypothetical protein
MITVKGAPHGFSGSHEQAFNEALLPLLWA